MKLTLREAAAGDLEQIARIEHGSFADPWSQQAFADFISREDTTFMVAVLDEEADPRVLGYSVLIRSSDEAELLNLAVVESERGKGIGARLLDAVVSFAINARVRALYLEVRESNTAARGLYETRGFAQVGRRRRYYRDPLEDALILQRGEL